MAHSAKRWGYAAWLLLIVVFAALHFIHLRADFPNHSPWIEDWAKYTDEGWYGNAAIRAHLFGHWYVPGDFNPAPAVPLWPFLEWLLFFVTGVNIAAARALSAAFFCLDLLLGYCLVRTNAPRWAGLLAVMLAVTSPFLYAFSRLAILEPMLIAFTLLALNLAVRVHRMQRPVAGAAIIGVLFTLMLLIKTSAVFLLPALAWALLAPLRPRWKLAVQCAVSAALAAALSFAVWMALVIHAGLLRDYKYLFFINKYIKPTEWYWPVLSLWWSLRGAMWGGRILIPLAAVMTLAAFVFLRTRWSRVLRADPAFVSSVLAALGYVLFMTYQNHPQPRYYTVVAFFACLIVGLGAAVFTPAVRNRDSQAKSSTALMAALVVLAASAGIAASDAAWTIGYVIHPEYTFVDAAQQLTKYIDQHPNGNRILLSLSGDELTLITHLPSLCDDFGTEDLPVKIAQYQPGWWATWNDIDPGTLEDLHVHDSLEQVAVFRALDHPERNELVLFKLHPLPAGRVRDPQKQNLQVALPDDKIDIPIE